MITLGEFKTLLANGGNKHFRLKLPNGSPVPVSFHVTEVGCVRKTFIDCGGTLRENVTCQLQVWVGEDVDHRIEAQKAAKILEKAKSFLPDDTVPVEIEYEDKILSQYTISEYQEKADSVILKLAYKHTDCLAPELCKLPSKLGSTEPCCGPSGCC